jgi:O-antigen/teichoic acid export membrane protein
MIAKRSDSTLRSLFAALALRGTALGGRFVFVIFAAKYMLPQDFGRFGLLAGLALLIPVLVGLEAYQVLLRRILQEPERAPDTRRFYAVFVLAGSLVSGAIGALTLAAFGWSATEVGLGAVVLMFEHIGLETSRNLINERLPTLAVLSVALRTGAWGVALPALFFVGLIPAPWTFETVLWFWIAGAIGAALAGMPIWRLFRPHGRDLHLRRGWGLLNEVVGRSWTWVVFTASLRVIETGGRFVCAWMISDAAAGRFTFVSMLASLSYIAQKGVVEPIYSPRLSALGATEDTHRDFRRINLAVIVGGTLCSVLGLAASVRLTGIVPPVVELVSFGLLCLAFACLSLAQPAHYRLYRWHKDRAIMTTGVAGCVAMVLSSVVATRLWGIAGAAAGVLLGALVLLLLKGRAARGLKS